MEAKFDGADFEEVRAEEPSAAHVEAIRKRIVSSLDPVKPLPSDSVLVSLLTAAFICLGVACAIPIRLKGLYAMTSQQRLADFVVILLCAPSLALALTGEIIPGARRRVSSAFVIAAVFSVTIAITALLFPDYSTAEFVTKGVRCLAIGTVCEILAAVLVWRVICLGMLTDRSSGILTAAVLSGMVGVFTLALHCPILNAAHILAWHVSVPVLGLAVGALVARRIEHRIRSGARESAPL